MPIQHLQWDLQDDLQYRPAMVAHEVYYNSEYQDFERHKTSFLAACNI